MKINKISAYKGLNLGKVITKEATEEEFKEALDKFLNQNIEVIEKDGVSVEGDTVNIDFEGFLDGTPFEGGKGEHYDLTLGSHTFIPGFEEQLIGKKKGDEVDVNVTFPENYQAENLKGKAVVFKCKVHKVQESKIPTLNDEFASKFGLKNAEELKSALKNQVFIQKSNKDINDYLAKFWDKVAEESDIELLDEDIKDKLDQMIDFYSQSMAGYGATMEQYLQMVGQTMDEFKNQIKPEAMKTKKIDLIMNHILEEEKLDITDEDVETELANIKNYYGLKDEDIERIKKENLDQVKKDLLKSKVSKFILNNNN